MQDKIFAICESLTNQGIKPTLENVRKELGGGSFSTINPILKQWKENQVKAPRQAIAIPPEAAKAAEQATALIWSIATEHHTETINAVKLECERIEQTALAERDEALAEIQTLETKTTALESKLAEMEAINSQLTLKNKQKDETINELRQENEKQQIKLEHCAKAAEKAENNAILYSENLNALKLDYAKQQLVIENTAKAMLEQQEEIKSLKQQLVDSENKEKSQIKELNSLKLNIQKLQTALDSSENATSEAKTELKEIRAELKQAQREAAKLAGMVETYEKGFNQDKSRN